MVEFCSRRVHSPLSASQSDIYESLLVDCALLCSSLQTLLLALDGFDFGCLRLYFTGLTKTSGRDVMVSETVWCDLRVQRPDEGILAGADFVGESLRVVNESRLDIDEGHGACAFDSSRWTQRLILPTP